jgi:hypothetical protein
MSSEAGDGASGRRRIRTFCHFHHHACPRLASRPASWYRPVHLRVVTARIGINVYFFAHLVCQLDIDAYDAAAVYSQKSFVTRDLAGLADLPRLRTV